MKPSTALFQSQQQNSSQRTASTEHLKAEIATVEIVQPVPVPKRIDLDTDLGDDDALMTDLSSEELPSDKLSTGSIQLMTWLFCAFTVLVWALSLMLIGG